MDRRGGYSVLIVSIFIILIIAIILVVILINGKDEPVRLNQSFNLSMNISYFNVTLSSNAVFPVNYFVSNATNILLYGQMFPSALEYFGSVSENSTIFLSAFSDKYYLNSSVCFIQSEKELCRVVMKLKALDYSVQLFSDRVVVDAKDGVLQMPIVCFSYKSNVANVYMNLTQIPVPDDLRTAYDLCYSIGYDIVGVVTFPIDVRRNQFVNSSEVMTVLLRDTEQENYKNIGDKTTGVMI